MPGLLDLQPAKDLSSVHYSILAKVSLKRLLLHGLVTDNYTGLGRPFVGYFSDSFGRINMAGTCTFLAGLFSLVIWIFAKSYGVLIFFSIIVGTVAGT